MLNQKLEEKVGQYGVHNITAVRLQSKGSIDYFAVLRNEISMKILLTAAEIAATGGRKTDVKVYARILNYIVKKGVKYDQNHENLGILKYPKHLDLNWAGTLEDISKYLVE